jgi:hypothetical protein
MANHIDRIDGAVEFEVIAAADTEAGPPFAGGFGYTGSFYYPLKVDVGFELKQLKPSLRLIIGNSTQFAGPLSISQRSGVHAFSGMAHERAFTLRQIHQARGDLYAISDDLKFLKNAACSATGAEEAARAALSIHLLRRVVTILFVCIAWH